MEHEHRRLGGSLWAGSQHADRAFHLCFQPFAHDVRQRFQGIRVQHLLGRHLNTAAVAEPFRDGTRGVLTNGRQFAANARRCRPGNAGPGGKNHALGCVTRRNTHTLFGGTSASSGLIGRALIDARACRRCLVPTGFLRHQVFHQRDHIGHGGVAKRLNLQFGDLEVIFDAVFNAHTHEGIQPEVNQWKLTGEVFNVVAHRLRHDGPHALLHGFPRLGIPVNGVNGDIIKA